MTDLAATLEQIRKFIRAELIGKHKELDALADAPMPLYDTFAADGLANWWLPADVGGRGLSLEESVDIVSELSYGDAGVAFTAFISILGTTMVDLYAGRELREQLLAPMAKTGRFCATLGSEAAAGSELARITTTAVRSGDKLVISGKKFFSTNADFADFLVVIARSEGDDHVAVVVPRQTPGISIDRRWNMLGLRASGTYRVSLSECRVPAANCLSGNGLRLLEIALNASRILIAATAIGVSRCIRDLGMEYGKRKSLRGAKLASNDVFGAKLAEMEIGIHAMREVCRAAARDFDAVMSRPDAAEEFVREGSLKSALVAKTFCGRTGWNIATIGSELFGGLGYTDELLIGKLVRDIRYVSIVEGGDDVLRDLIYKRFVVPPKKRA